jgi:glutamyl-tRNA synthetase
MSDGRFAPSPSGELHLGNLRTALLAWLFARSAGSRFIVRIEDLDPDRSRPEHEASQLADLAAFGLDWDEPPVRQSERFHLYRDAVAQLEAAEMTYPCWCTRGEIQAAASAPHGDGPEGAYPGTCRRLTSAQRTQLERERGAPCVRVAAGAARERFVDEVLGPRDGVVDDMVIVRKDGVPAYNLAVVVDDALQAIGEVVRGDDLASGTPRQLLLQRLLGHAHPRYAHVPLLYGADQRRLSKRDGAVTLTQRAAELGQDPVRVRSLLAHSCGLCEREELPSLAELVERFDPQQVGSIATTLGE